MPSLFHIFILTLASMKKTKGKDLHKTGLPAVVLQKSTAGSLVYFCKIMSCSQK